MSEHYDAHCHIDFANNAQEIAMKAKDRNVHALCSTVIPSSFVSAEERFADAPCITVGLGIHPWWIDEARVSEVDVAHFDDLVRSAPFIGEVGLDFSRRRKGSHARQVEIFQHLMKSTREHAPGRPLFIHAVKSCEEVIDILDEYGMFESNICVFHWFSGTREQFGRALSKGALFSVSMRMIAQGDGAFITSALPSDHLLAETDSPPHEGSPWSVDTWIQEIENTTQAIAEVRSEELEMVKQTLKANYQTLLSAMPTHR